MKRLLILLLLPLLVQKVTGQPNGPVTFSAGPQHLQPQEIGDIVPNLLLTSLLYAEDTAVQISQFKGRLLVLDFLATSCKSCLEELPRLQQLQQQFEGQLQILLVTREPKEKVQRFFTTNKLAKTIRLPIVTGDSLLHRLYPHELISHVAWISPEGKTVAITGPQYLQAGNIAQLLKGETVRWPQKRDVTDFQPRQPLLMLNTDAIPYFSQPTRFGHAGIVGHLGGVPRQYHKLTDSAEGTLRVVAVNMPVVDLYKEALGLPAHFPKSHLVLEVGDTGRYLNSGGYLDQWQLQNTYCYEGAFPLATCAVRYRHKMQQDLDFYFGLKGRLVPRKTTCLFLVRSAAASLVTTPLKKSAVPEGFLQVSVANLLHHLNQQLYNRPVLDRTGISGKAYLLLPSEAFSSIDRLRPYLKKHGFSLKEGTDTVSMLVLTEHSFTQN